MASDYYFQINQNKIILLSWVAEKQNLQSNSLKECLAVHTRPNLQIEAILH